MLAKTPIGTRFYRWVAAQPPEREYLCDVSAECACGRFQQEELGISREEVTRSFYNYWDGANGRCGVDLLYSDVDPAVTEFWREFNEIATSGDSTFGALRKRIEEAMPELIG